MSAASPYAVAQIIAKDKGQFLVVPSPGHTATFGHVQFAEMRRLADGSYLLTFFREWITAQKAAHILECSEASLARLAQITAPGGKPLLATRRPSPGVWQFELASVVAHARGCEDPEYWGQVRKDFRIERKK